MWFSTSLQRLFTAVTYEVLVLRLKLLLTRNITFNKGSLWFYWQSERVSSLTTGIFCKIFWLKGRELIELSKKYGTFNGQRALLATKEWIICQCDALVPFFSHDFFKNIFQSIILDQFCVLGSYVDTGISPYPMKGKILINKVVKTVDCPFNLEDISIL